MTNATEEGRGERPEIGRRTVLIVDDEEDLRTCTRMFLEGEGYQVLEAGDGLAGLEVLSHEHVDVVLLDWKMQGMTGERFLQALNETELGATVAVVVLSGVNELPGVRAPFLPKPVDPDKLLRAVETARA